jgi:TolB-like protein
MIHFYRREDGSRGYCLLRPVPRRQFKFYRFILKPRAPPIHFECSTVSVLALFHALHNQRSMLAAAMGLTVRASDLFNQVASVNCVSGRNRHYLSSRSVHNGQRGGRFVNGAEQESLTLLLIGPMAAAVGDTPRPVPASRKTRAILGYLALVGQPVSRERLCELFFDIPDDPRAALRWSLTKLRPLVDTPRRKRLCSERDMLWLDLNGASVDALALFDAERQAEQLDVETLRGVLGGCAGELLADASLPDRPDFTAWLQVERQAMRRAEAKLLSALLAQLHDDPEAQLPWWRRCIERDALDEAGYHGFAAALIRLGRRSEAEALLASAARAFRSEGIAMQAAPLPAPESAQSPEPKPDRPRQDKPVVAVLPFNDMSAEPLAAYLVDGLCEGVIHALSRFKSLTVVTRMSTARFAGQLADPRAVGEALGADVLVGASLVRQGARLHVRWRCAASTTAMITGFGDITGDLSDIWQLQEDIGAHIATRIEPTALAESLGRTLRRPTQSNTVWDLYLRGVHAAFAELDQDYAGGLDYFEQALALDADFHPAAALAPWAAAYGNLISTPVQMAGFAAMARRAVRLGGDDARTLAMAGTAVLYLEHDFAFAQKAISRALELNPNEYAAWICAGWISVQSGDHDQAMAQFDRAERLNPLAYAKDGIYGGRALSYFYRDQLDEAEHFVRAAIDNQAGNPSALCTGVAVAARCGDTAALASRRAAFLSLFPQGLKAVPVRALPFRRPELRDKLFSALKDGGIPD